MKLRSKQKELSPEGNYVSVSVGKYTYKIDLLTLWVYDQDNCKYTIAECLEKGLEAKLEVDALKNVVENNKNSQDTVNSKLSDTLDACLTYIKALQDKVITLTSDVNKLKK